MVGKYPVITLCGSTRFKEQFLEAQKRLTLEGNIVISVGLFGHSGDSDSTGAACGNIMETLLGRSAIPAHYTEHLELLPVIDHFEELQALLLP